MWFSYLSWNIRSWLVAEEESTPDVNTDSDYNDGDTSSSSLSGLLENKPLPIATSSPLVPMRPRPGRRYVQHSRSRGPLQSSLPPIPFASQSSRRVAFGQQQLGTGSREPDLAASFPGTFPYIDAFESDVSNKLDEKESASLKGGRGQQLRGIKVDKWEEGSGVAKSLVNPAYARSGVPSPKLLPRPPRPNQLSVSIFVHVLIDSSPHYLCCSSLWIIN